MNVYKGFLQFDAPSVVVVGSFDGVHSGHRRLIAEANELSDRLAYRSVIVTFDPHPRQVLRGENRLLTTIDERIILFEKAGVRELVVVNFTRDFASINAESFVRDYLIDKLRARVVFTGEGHSFGNNRGGDQEILKKYNIETRHVDRYDGISSTRVRQVVQNGEMQLASHLLGGDYMVLTPITEPTKLLPSDGEYMCVIDDKELQLSIEELRMIKAKNKILVNRRL